MPRSLSFALISCLVHLCAYSGTYAWMEWGQAWCFATPPRLTIDAGVAITLAARPANDADEPSGIEIAARSEPQAMSAPTELSAPAPSSSPSRQLIAWTARSPDAAAVSIDHEPEFAGHEPAPHAVAKAESLEAAPIAPVAQEVATSEQRRSRSLAKPSTPQAAVAVEGARVDQLPRKLPTNLPPRYPAALLAAGIEGRVVALVTIRQDGTVSAATLHQSSGYAEFDQAALEAVRAWRFEPARLATVAVEHTVRVPVQFFIER